MNKGMITLQSLTVVGLPGLMILLALGGIGISAYLVWGYTSPGVTLACGEAAGCETVKNSVYANLFGLPLPLLGLVAYVITLTLIILQRLFVARQRAGAAYIALAMFGIALMGVLYSAYLTYLELFVIYAICRWCVASAIIMSVLLVLSMVNLQRVNSFAYPP